MSDLISRQAAIDAVNNIMLTKEGFIEREVVVEELLQLPSAQPQRMKGRWESYLTEGLKYKCSECGSRFTIPWHFCPNCGSDNRGEDNA